MVQPPLLGHLPHKQGAAPAPRVHLRVPVHSAMYTRTTVPGPAASPSAVLS